ncbi:MAG TPA: MFS transporter [Rhodopila sp.]|uniref:MFS transporter n=1 Tax=Rhodopila sp. TaxID=2480087 RepID=UPI002C626F3C|nr:MFS transporter [Rhodopila sp.]HVY16683.1 MFS transporter [Rhodopila sp.]
MPRAADETIESPRSWQAAILTLVILSVGFGAPLLVVVGLRQIQSDLGTDRSVIALASALIWIGNAIGGVVMGRVAVAIGMRWTAVLGVVSIAAGLALSGLGSGGQGSIWAIYVGHGLLIGLFGLGALYAPLTVYVSHWFDKRRGTALALVASGQYVAGMFWPPMIEYGNAHVGWQTMMLIYGGLMLAVLPLVLLLRAPPELRVGTPSSGPAPGRLPLGLPPIAVQVTLCFAGFFCCVPMAIPASHLVAFCGDIGIPAADGAAMLSVMLTCAFISRQLWGLLADRVGGLRTILFGSIAQIVTLASFLTTRNEVGLFLIAGAYGLGFSGLIPAYAVAVRDLFPAREASWRIPTVLMFLMGGMAFGSWFGGKLYDLFMSYQMAFAVGVAFNAVHLVVILLLVVRSARQRTPQLVTAAE